MLETTFNIKRLREMFSHIDEAAGVAQCQAESQVLNNVYSCYYSLLLIFMVAFCCPVVA